MLLSSAHAREGKGEETRDRHRGRSRKTEAEAGRQEAEAGRRRYRGSEEGNNDQAKPESNAVDVWNLTCSRRAEKTCTVDV